MMSARNFALKSSGVIGLWLLDSRGWPFAELVWLNAATTALLLVFIPLLQRLLLLRRDGEAVVDGTAVGAAPVAQGARVSPSESMLRSRPMTKTLLGFTVLLSLTGCGTASIKATPLKEQNAAQVQADRKRCDEWAKSTASVRTGFATCLIAAGYEATSEVGSTSQTVRLAGASRTTEPTNVLLDVLQCDSDAQREAERNLGMITSWMRDTFGWKFNTERRQQAFIDCLKPRGYEIGRR